MVDRLIGFAEKLAPFRVPDDDIAASRGAEHTGGDFTREGTLGFPVDILGAEGDRRSLQRLADRRQGRERGGDHDVHV